MLFQMFFKEVKHLFDVFLGFKFRTGMAGAFEQFQRDIFGAEHRRQFGGQVDRLLVWDGFVMIAVLDEEWRCSGVDVGFRVGSLRHLRDLGDFPAQQQGLGRIGRGVRVFFVWSPA